MEYYFFVIIVIIVLKILFWTFYFHTRAQRMRHQSHTTHRFIIVRAQPVRSARSNPYSDRSAIIDHAEPMSATGPPPYTDVVKDGSFPLPPSYDQAMAVLDAGAYSAVPTSDTDTCQGSAMPPYRHVNPYGPYSGSTAVLGYSSSASQPASQPASHTGGCSQPLTGQMAPGASGASVGQNVSVPQQ